MGIPGSIAVVYLEEARRREEEEEEKNRREQERREQERASSLGKYSNEEEMKADLTERLEQATTLKDYKGINNDAPSRSIFKKESWNEWCKKFRELSIKASSYDEINLLSKDMPRDYPYYEEYRTKRDGLIFEEKVKPITNSKMALDAYICYPCFSQMANFTESIYNFLRKIEQMTATEDIETLLKTVSDDIRPIVKPIALDRIEQLKSNPI